MTKLEGGKASGEVDPGAWDTLAGDQQVQRPGNGTQDGASWWRSHIFSRPVPNNLRCREVGIRWGHGPAPGPELWERPLGPFSP